MLAKERSRWEMTYNTAFLCSLLGKIHKAYLQVKREACDCHPGSLQQDTLSRGSGDACDFTHEGQEAPLESTTLGLQRQHQSPAAQDMTAAFHFEIKGRDI